MRISRAAASVAIVLALCARGRDASAQTRLSPTAEGAVGYAFLRDEESSNNLPFGWMASLGGSVTDWFALVGEVGGHYETLTQDGVNATVKLHTFTTGPRFMVTARTRVAPFGQVLIGIAHGALTVDVAGSDFATRGTSFVYQPGAGVDLNLSTRRAFRFELDFRGLRDGGRSLNQWRFAAAIVFRN